MILRATSNLATISIGLQDVSIKIFRFVVPGIVGLPLVFVAVVNLAECGTVKSYSRHRDVCTAG